MAECKACGHSDGFDFVQCPECGHIDGELLIEYFIMMGVLDD